MEPQRAVTRPVATIDHAAEDAARTWFDDIKYGDVVRFGTLQGHRGEVNLIKSEALHISADRAHVGRLLVLLKGGSLTGALAVGTIAVPKGRTFTWNPSENPGLTVRFLLWAELRALYEREKPHGDAGSSSMTGSQYSG